MKKMRYEGILTIYVAGWSSGMMFSSGLEGEMFFFALWCGIFVSTVTNFFRLAKVHTEENKRKEGGT